MKKINIFCFGFGQVAKNFIKKINTEKFSINLSVTTREESKAKQFNEIKYNNFIFNDEIFDNRLIENLKNSDHILISIPPINGKDIVIKYFGEVIKECNPKWITYLSATSVYGDHKGEWVNEESETNPKSASGIDRLAAEKSWISFISEYVRTDLANLALCVEKISSIDSFSQILACLEKSTVSFVTTKS